MLGSGAGLGAITISKTDGMTRSGIEQENANRTLRKLGAISDQVGSSDPGEPSGSTMRPIQFARLPLVLGLTLLLAGCVTAGQVEAEHARLEQQQADAVKSRALDAEMAAIEKNCRSSYVACDQQRYDALVRVWGQMNDDNELLWRKRLVIDEQLDKGQITLLQANAMNAEDTAEVTARRRQVNATEQAAQAATLMEMEMAMPPNS